MSWYSSSTSNGSRTGIFPHSPKRSGKLKSFRHDTQGVASQRAGLDSLARIKSLENLQAGLEPIASYLSTAEAGLPEGHAWVGQVKRERQQILPRFRDPKKRDEPTFRQRTARRLAGHKNEYARSDLTLHLKARLGAIDSGRKAKLTKDERLKALRELSKIELMPRQHLLDYEACLGGLRSCFALTERELRMAPVCRHCGFKPDRRSRTRSESCWNSRGGGSKKRMSLAKSKARQETRARNLQSAFRRGKTRSLTREPRQRSLLQKESFGNDRG